jgi:hypothetical protein
MAGRLGTATYSSRQREKANYETDRQSVPTRLGAGGNSNGGGTLQQLGVVMTGKDKTDDEDFWDEFFGIKEWANED